MSARAELEARARAGFRAVMLSNHTAEKFASESSARELRFLCSVFDEECSDLCLTCVNISDTSS